MTRARFVEMVTSDLPDAPPYFTYDALLNSRERPTLERALERALRPLTFEEVLALAARGAQLLDTRAPAEFEGGYLTGSVNVALDGSYATWSGTFVDPHNPIVVIADPGRELEAVKGLSRIGLDAVAGYLDGGVDRAGDCPRTLDQIDRIDALSLAERLTSPDPPLLLDVRNPTEWERGRVEPSVNVPLSRLTRRLGSLPRDRDIVVYCATGYRSAIAASLLRRAGFPRVADLSGGYAGQLALAGATSRDR